MSDTSSPPTPAAQEPRGIFHLRGWLGILLLGPVAIAAALSAPHFAEGSWRDFLTEVGGGSLIVLAVIWRSYATFFIGGRKSRSLVREGPYALCRHPLYSGTFVVGLGAAVMLQSLVFLLAFAVITPLLYHFVVNEEERILAANHGAEFDAFVRAVPRRFLPSSWPRFDSRAVLQVDMRAQTSQLRRSLTTLAVIPLVELVQHLRWDGILPALFALP